MDGARGTQTHTFFSVCRKWPATEAAAKCSARKSKSVTAQLRWKLRPEQEGKEGREKGEGKEAFCQSLSCTVTSTHCEREREREHADTVRHWHRLKQRQKWWKHHLSLLSLLPLTVWPCQTPYTPSNRSAAPGCEWPENNLPIRRASDINIDISKAVAVQWWW